MSQQQKLEKVLDLLLSEDSDQAAELLHQIIVEKARVIYESIVEEDDAEEDKDKDELDESDEVGGEPNKDFTNDISSDEEEIDADEHNGGEAGGEEAGEGDEFDDEEDNEYEEGDVEDRVQDLESQLADLRAEFDELMGEELQEPEHSDLAGEFEDEVEPADEFDNEDGDNDMPDFGGEEKVVGEVVASMFEKKKSSKLEKAPEAKDKKKDKKVDEETQFLKKTADTGQKGTAKFVGTGKDSSLGAEQGKSVFTRAPSKPNYGGKSDNLLGSKSTGGEYGKFNAGSGQDDTPSDNVDVNPKKNGSNVDKSEGKFVGTGKGSQSGQTGIKSPLTKAPTKPGNMKKD